MTLKAYRVPPATFAALAQGGGGEDGARCLLGAQCSKHLLLLHRVARLARSSAYGDAMRAYDRLAAVQAERPDAAAAVIQHPAVGAWARQAVDVLAAPDSAPAAELAWMPALAAAASIHAGVPFRAEVAPVDGGVVLPSLGRAATATGNIRATGDDVEVDGVPLPRDLSVETTGWQSLRRLSATSAGKTIELLIDDLDPYRAPGMDNAGDRLPAAEAARWQSILLQTWDLLVRRHINVADEMAIMIRVLTPLRPPLGGQVSATSRDAFGAIFLSAPQDPVSLAVTMAHEVQHAKLSALLDIVPMTLQDDGSRYYAPWREDPRPISGLLQGAYAFLGVAGFWLRQSRSADGASALAEFARWRGAVRLVVDTLAESDRLTGPGRAFVSGMDQTIRRWDAEPVPGEALDAARQASEEHWEGWRQRNGELSLPVR
jgi:HEXXH motif-containing protein